MVLLFTLNLCEFNFTQIRIEIRIILEQHTCEKKKLFDFML